MAPTAPEDMVEQRVTNEEVRSRTATYNEVVITIKQRKLQMFGHISRMEEKIIMKIVMEGIRSQGRSRRRWINEAMEWTYAVLAKRFMWHKTIKSINVGKGSSSGLLVLRGELIVCMYCMDKGT